MEQINIYISYVPFPLVYEIWKKIFYLRNFYYKQEKSKFGDFLVEARER